MCRQSLTVVIVEPVVLKPAAICHQRLAQVANLLLVSLQSSKSREDMTVGPSSSEYLREFSNEIQNGAAVIKTGARRKMIHEENMN